MVAPLQGGVPRSDRYLPTFSMYLEKIPVSVIVLTHNEELNIEACLSTIVDWAAEVFVVDSGSTDETLRLAAKYPVCTFQHPFENYSAQRNWAQASLPLTQEWVFHIDADERVSPELTSQLVKLFNSGMHELFSGLMVRRRIEFLGRHITHGGIYPTYHSRLFRKDKGHCENRAYDQHFLIEGHVGRLEADLIEVTASSLSSWTARHNRWAQMEASHLLNTSGTTETGMITGKIDGSPIERRRWLRSGVFERSPIFLRALVYFMFRYLLRMGFLDGVPGLIYHVLHGFWFRFYTDACLYELRRQQMEKVVK